MTVAAVARLAAELRRLEQILNTVKCRKGSSSHANVDIFRQGSLDL